MGKAHPLQGLQGFGVVIDAGEHQIAEAGRQGLVIGEQLPVPAVHPRKDLRHPVVEVREDGKAGKGRHPGPHGILLRQDMGLLVLQHLNPVLPPPQVVIGAGQFRGAVGRHMPRLLQGDEGLQRARGAQVRVPPAEDQLLGLDEELDLPDAPPAQLQVRPRRREPVIHLVDVDLALDGMDVGNGGEVQAAPPDEGLQGGQERLPRQRIPGADPGLDHGGPFPVLSDALIIFQRRGHGHGRRRRGRVGSQAQVDTEDIAVLGPLLQQIGQGPGQAQGHR